MMLFNDSEWKYNFIILMTAIIILCGIYTFIKAYMSKRKKNNNKENNK